jgi:hypothetical protein
VTKIKQVEKRPSHVTSTLSRRLLDAQGHRMFVKLFDTQGAALQRCTVRLQETIPPGPRRETTIYA